MNDEQKEQMINESKETWLPLRVYLIISLLFLGGLWLGYWVGKHSKETSTDKSTSSPSQWIGRLSAGDGKGNIFSAPNVEIGLRADGVMTWRLHAPDPISLVTTQAEAKK